jgi:hypothetical protein
VFEKPLLRESVFVIIFWASHSSSSYKSNYYKGTRHLAFAFAPLLPYYNIKTKTFCPFVIIFHYAMPFHTYYITSTILQNISSSLQIRRLNFKGSILISHYFLIKSIYLDKIYLVIISLKIFPNSTNDSQN